MKTILIFGCGSIGNHMSFASRKLGYKVYITDIIQSYCMFNLEIISVIDDKTSNLSCVHRGKKRTERKFN